MAVDPCAQGSAGTAEHRHSASEGLLLRDPMGEQHHAAAQLSASLQL